MTYKNQFRNIWRRFIKGRSFVSCDGEQWHESGVSEDLIKRLPYYVVVE